MAGSPAGMARLLHAALVGAPKTDTKSPALMSWVGAGAFTSRFSFRNVPAGRAEVEFTFESAEPVWITALAAYAGPDCMVREFAHGLVLANPSDRVQRFDLAAIAPGGNFRRLQATPNQDAVANNGAPVAATVTLPPRDALFLRRELPGK